METADGAWRGICARPIGMLGFGIEATSMAYGR